MHTDIRGWTLAGQVGDEDLERVRAAAHERLGRFVSSDGSVSFDAPAHVARAIV